MKRYLFAYCAIAAMVVGLVHSPASWAKPVVLPLEGPFECLETGDPPAKGKFSIELGISPKGITIKMGVSAAKPEPVPAIDAVCPTLVPAYIEQLFKLVGEALTAQRMPREVAEVVGKNEKNRPVATRLFEQVNVRIKDVPLQQAIKNLAQVSGVRMVPDYTDLRAAAVNLDAPVSLVVEHTSVHTALQQLLQPARLTYEIRDEVVTIVSQERNAHKVPGFKEAKVKAEHAQRLFEIGERHRRAGDLEVARKFYQQAHFLMPTSLHGRVAITRLVEIDERLRDTSEEQGAPEQPGDPEQTFHDMRNRSIPLGLVEVSY